MSEPEGDEPAVRRAVVLDYLPHGLSTDGRPQYAKSPAGYAMDIENFQLYEVAFDAEERLTIGTTVTVNPPAEREIVTDARQIEYDGLSSGAKTELEYVISDLVEEEEDRFVDVYTNAQPITLRLHQLNLLPGIGDKLRDNILDERKRGPFESFADLEERVTGLHDPAGIIVERILEEFQDEDLKYKVFVRGEE